MREYRSPKWTSALQRMYLHCCCCCAGALRQTDRRRGWLMRSEAFLASHNWSPWLLLLLRCVGSGINKVWCWGAARAMAIIRCNRYYVSVRDVRNTKIFLWFFEKFDPHPKKKNLRLPILMLLFLVTPCARNDTFVVAYLLVYSEHARRAKIYGVMSIYE